MVNKKIYRKLKSLAGLFLFFLILLGGKVTVKAEDEEIIVWHTCVAGSQGRYYQNIQYETNSVCKGGNWYGQYWDGSKWVTYTSGNTFHAGAHKYNVDIRVWNIAGAKPSKPVQKSIYFSQGTTYKCIVSSTENSADFYYRLFANWNSGDKDDLFNSMKDTGYGTLKVPDPVVGYYYTINNSSGNSLGSVSGASYQTSSAIPFDVSDIGRYLHVKAKSYSGVLSDEKIIYLSKDNEGIIPKRKLTISCGTGISKVTATGSISGTTITATGSEKKSGSFYIGESITLTETPVSNGVFTDWNINRSISYLSGYDSGKATTKFRMPNSSTTVTANGKLYYTITIKPGEGIKSVTLDGQTTSSSSGITKRYYKGDSYAVSTTLKDYYITPKWTADIAGYSKTDMQSFTEKMGTQNITYTVSAKKEIYTVSYIGLSGASPSSIESASGEGESNQKVSSTAVTRKGFTFAGWLCVEGPSGMKNKMYYGGESFVLKQKTVFSAQWKAGTTTVNLYTNKPAEASSKVNHEILISGESFELKDINTYAATLGYTVKDLLNANGIEYFGIVQSQLQSSNYIFKGGINGIGWFGDVNSETLVENLNYADRNKVILYDITTKNYYRINSEINDYSNIFFTGPGIGNPVSNINQFVKIGQSYIVYSEPSDFKELVFVSFSLEGRELLSSLLCNYIRVNSYEQIAERTDGYTKNCIVFRVGSGNKGMYYVTGSGEIRFLGDSFKIPVPSSWKWNSTNSRTGDGYYSKDFSSLLSSNSAISLPDVSKIYEITGWNTKRWNTKADGSGISYSASTNISSIPLTNESKKAINLYAEWSPITYTIRYMGNGGKISGSSTYYDVTYKYDTTYRYPQSLFEKESENNGTTSYHFTKWYNSSQLTGTSYEVDEEFENLTDISGKVIYRYAGWSAEKIHYFIHFNPNGAVENHRISDISGIEYLEPVQLPSVAGYYSYEGYEFVGWILGTAASYEEYVAAPEKYQIFGTNTKVSKLSNKDMFYIQMYALWKPVEKEPACYTVRFDGNGADFGSMEEQTILCGTANTKLNKNIFGLTDYKFTGWNTKPNGNGAEKEDEAIADFSVSEGNIITLYAQWAPDVYYVEYDGNGSESGSMNKSVFAYDTEENLAGNEYEKRGYHAEDKRTWTTQANGSGNSYADTQKVNNLAEQPNGLIPNTVKLYVQWTANQYTIRFDGNGATQGSMADQTKTYGTPITLLENQYQKEGYEFKGWSREPDGSGGLLPDKYEITNDLSEKDKDVITLYAQWKDVKPPVITPVLPDDGSEDGSGYDLVEDELIYKWTNQDVVLQFTAEDTGSGMKTLHLESEDGKIKVTNKDTIKKTITKEGITRYDLTAEDNTGNKSVLHITVKIDKIPPTADNEDGYVLDSSGTMTKTIKAHDEGGSGIRSFELYSGNAEDEENSSLTLLKSADNISGDNAELTYTFQDDMVSDKMYYTLVIADNAGNVTKKVFHVDPALSLQTKAWKYNKTTVTDDTETLTYMQYGDMRCWFETVLNGYMTEVTYDFCDELNELGLEDVTHALTPAETVTDNLVVYLPKTMVFEETYTVTVRGKRGEREVSVTLNLMHTEMKSKPHPAIRYQNDMAMPWGGGEWIDYEKLAEEQKKKAQEQKKQIDN